ncbi:phosphate ABC transporter permease [Sphingomonas sp. Root710]|uniref:phosphate ABC transporter permease PstA n=1 Tax=Sphingomonas sp. Root710 TaxID=1736594 RepID=UPI0006FBCBA0|nr:phosphate ABC transporter permease PstA [Sphingomonas sp. Root710]KRB86417.1 phosphate ABC transporter permease [Sphingomonas sp. Root710]
MTINATGWRSEAMQRRVARRYASERRFRGLGFFAVALSGGFLAFLLVTMFYNGIGGFTQTEIRVPVNFASISAGVTPSALQGPNAEEALGTLDLESLAATSATEALGENGPSMLSDGAWLSLREALRDDPTLITRKADIWVPASVDIDQAAKGADEPEPKQQLAALKAKDAVRTGFSMTFLTASDSTDPTVVGIWGAFKGTLLTMLVTALLAFPVGTLAALYLEEYAPRNRWTDLIEVSINNLAAVPSIIFGLLGLAVFLNFMDMPRSAPIVGGLTLALMTMPVIVIASRNAIKAVPPSIRDAALAMGASPVQVVFHHVLPLAMPGILTGTIIGMARALGETAPLIMIGMRAFISSPPTSFTEPATVLPVQIFLWSDEVSRGFVEKTSAAIIVLLAFLMTMNATAIYLRNHFERRW